MAAVSVKRSIGQKNYFLFALFLQKAVKMLIDNIDKVPVSLVTTFFDVLLSVKVKLHRVIHNNDF